MTNEEQQTIKTLSVKSPESGDKIEKTRMATNRPEVLENRVWINWAWAINRPGHNWMDSNFTFTDVF